jgi:uncharacterized protein (TIGR00251 family)
MIRQESSSGVSFAIRVQPGAKRNAILKPVGDVLKIAVTAPPRGNRANKACVEFLADLLNLPRSSITIVSGQSSRNKVIRVVGMSAHTLRSKLQP